MIKSLVMMALGGFRFGISTGAHQVFSRRAAYRWGQADRIGRRPALHYVGPDVEEITLEGVIHPHFRGGLRQMERMRLSASFGAPLMLVDGFGFVWQRWVITEVTERRTVLMADGAPRMIEFTVTLKAYGEDLI